MRESKENSMSEFSFMRISNANTTLFSLPTSSYAHYIRPTAVSMLLDSI
jgi:hypothetical protein